MIPARKFLADALGVDEGSIPRNAAIGCVDAWDSLGHARLLLALEAVLGRSLVPEEAVGIGSIADVEAILRLAS